MCVSLETALAKWRMDPSVEFVIIDQAPLSKDFCVGEDVQVLWGNRKTFHQRLSELLASIYSLHRVMSLYPKPVVSIANGQARGCGLGLFKNTTYQIASDRTVVSFPETALGSVPSAGATWYLPRLRGETGVWLAMTGTRLTGRDVAGVGLASHFCDSNEIEAFKTELIRSGLNALEGLEPVSEVSFENHLSDIDQLFAGNCAKAIFERLKKGDGWAHNQASRISAKSPLSTKIALRQLRTGPFLDSIKQALILEHRILSRLIETQNYREGHRAALIDMDYCPDWKPSSLLSVTQDMVSYFFSPLGDAELSISPVTTPELCLEDLR